MPNYRESSKRKLAACHPYLQLIFNQIIDEFDNTIICGYRTLDAQEQVFNEGKSQIEWPDSKHNQCYDDIVKEYEFDNFPEIPYSLAVDSVPYDKNIKGIDWNDINRINMFAGRVLQKASDLGIKLKWGGDWDQDTETKDNKFNDLVHFELDLT